jgi:hypothetical protein
VCLAQENLGSRNDHVKAPVWGERNAEAESVRKREFMADKNGTSRALQNTHSVPKWLPVTSVTVHRDPFQHAASVRVFNNTFCFHRSYYAQTVHYPDQKTYD